jgi:hypothetical protein
MTSDRSPLTLGKLVVAVLVLAIMSTVVVVWLDFANLVATIVTFATLVLGPLVSSASLPHVPDRMRQVVTRFRLEVVAVFGFAAVALVLFLLPIPFPPQGGRWWLWKGTMLLCLVMAVAVVVFPSREHLTLLAVPGTFALLLVAGIAGTQWWPASDMDNCGAAQIVAETRLRAQVATALTQYQGLAGSSGCRDAVSVVDAGDDLHDQLLAGLAPMTAVVVSDPAALRGLSGAWKNLGLEPDPPGRWLTIGLDQASVFLPATAHRDRDRVELSELAGLKVGRFAPADPIALAVQTAATSGWIPTFGVPAADLSGRVCPAALVLPTRAVSTCAAPKALTAARVVDQDANPIGAPVLGVGLRAASADAVSRPAGPARQAAAEFMAWLEQNPGALGLHELTEPVTRVLGGLGRQNEVVRQETEQHAVHVIVVLDASLSLGRASDQGRFGAFSPWRPTVDGLKRWIAAGDRRAVAASDRLSIVVAHTGRGGVDRRIQDPVTGALPRDWPPGAAPGQPGVPLGETGLVAALERARQVAAGQRRPERRQLTVLLTDGVNAFTEKPVPTRSALAGVQVVVVRAGNGCAAVRALVQDRCRSADLTATDVAAQLGALVAQVRDARPAAPGNRT